MRHARLPVSLGNLHAEHEVHLPARLVEDVRDLVARLGNRERAVRELRRVSLVQIEERPRRDAAVHDVLAVIARVEPAFSRVQDIVAFRPQNPEGVGTREGLDGIVGGVPRPVRPRPGEGFVKRDAGAVQVEIAHRVFRERVIEIFFYVEGEALGAPRAADAEYEPFAFFFVRRKINAMQGVARAQVLTERNRLSLRDCFARGVEEFPRERLRRLAYDRRPLYRLRQIPVLVHAHERKLVERDGFPRDHLRQIFPRRFRHVRAPELEKDARAEEPGVLPRVVARVINRPNQFRVAVLDRRAVRLKLHADRKAVIRHDVVVELDGEFHAPASLDLERVPRNVVTLFLETNARERKSRRVILPDIRRVHVRLHDPRPVGHRVEIPREVEVKLDRVLVPEILPVPTGYNFLVRHRHPDIDILHVRANRPRELPVVRLVGRHVRARRHRIFGNARPVVRLPVHRDLYRIRNIRELPRLSRRNPRESRLGRTGRLKRRRRDQRERRRPHHLSIHTPLLERELVSKTNQFSVRRFRRFGKEKMEKEF